jgi:hypothetical protein
MPVEGGGVSVRCHGGREMIGCDAGQHAYQGDDSSTKTAPGHANKGARDQTPHRDRATTDNEPCASTTRCLLSTRPLPAACCCLLLGVRCPLPLPTCCLAPAAPCLSCCPGLKLRPHNKTPPALSRLPRPGASAFTTTQRPPTSDHHPATNCPSSAQNHACRPPDCHALHLSLNPRSPPASAPPRPSTVAPHSAPRPRCRLHLRLVPPSTAPGTPTASPGPTATR